MFFFISVSQLKNLQVTPSKLYESNTSLNRIAVNYKNFSRK